MSRPTTYLALVQTLLIIAGFLTLGAILKFSGYPATFGVRWNPLSVFLREHGMWLLFVPILWVVFATWARNVDRGFLSYRIAIIIGLCIAIAIIGAFLYASTFAYTRRLLIGLL